ncbi:MAG: hypothetical protein QOF46_2223 [Paraburkholderia sp.]|nr:hypothetical protein [Paraburkholderia sp.]
MQLVSSADLPSRFSALNMVGAFSAFSTPNVPNTSNTSNTPNTPNTPNTLTMPNVRRAAPVKPRSRRLARAGSR